MTSLDPILSLRPSGNSSAALAEGLNRAKDAYRSAEETVAAARQARDDGLLDAPPKVFAELDRKLSEEIDTAEKIATIVATLETRLAIARRSETRAAVENAKLEYDAAGQARANWWARSQSKLAEILAEGVLLDEALSGAWHNWNRVKASASKTYSEDDIPRLQTTGNAAADWRQDVQRMVDPIPRRSRQPVDESEAERKAGQIDAA